MEKKRVYFVATTLFTTLVISLMMVSVSAGLLSDWINPTGRLSSQLTNVTVAVTGANIAQITYVESPTVTLTEATSSTIGFDVHVSDPDGASDIDTSTVYANFSKGGETTRTSAVCTSQGAIDTTTLNFSCSIDVWYWDIAAADWTVNVRANDYGNLTEVYNLTQSATVNSLKAMVITPSALTWAALTTGVINASSTNDPTTINNTGNYDSTIDLTGLNLLGETTPADSLNAAEFTVKITDACDGQALVNASSVTVTSSDANRGNLSAGAGAGQEALYYCIPLVPNIPSQTYSTGAASGGWTVAYP